MKILVLQGPPGCGKSTWAKEFVKGKKDWVIVCRDSLREGRGEYWIPSQEDYITALENNAVSEALHQGLNVIIDATNLNHKTIDKWTKLAEETGAEIEFKDLYIPFREAVERDKKRGESGGRLVGKSQIKKYYRLYYPERLAEEEHKTVNHFRLERNRELPAAVICDLDGTLAWMQNRSPYDYKNVDKDEVDPNLLRLLNILMGNGIYVIFLSGREGTEECIEKTTAWLESHLEHHTKHKMDSEYKLYELHTRTAGDYRGDEIIKRELYDKYVKDWWDVICVFDDRNKVVNMWRELGLMCCQVADGDF